MGDQYNVYPSQQSQRPGGGGAPDMFYGMNYQIPQPPQNENFSQNVPQSHRYQGQGHGKEGKPITRNRTSYSCHVCRRRKVKCDKVHPTCSNCLKSGEECIYDSNSATPKSVQSDRATVATPINPDFTDVPPPHSAKRRRLDVEPKYGEEYGTQTNPQDQLSGNDPYPLDPQLRSRSPDHKIIEERLDRLTTMVEQLSRNGFQGPFEPNLPQDPSDPRRMSFQPQEPFTPAPDTTTAKRKAPKSYRSSSQWQSSSRGDSSERGSEHDFPIISPQNSSDLADPINNLNLGHLSFQDNGRTRYVGNTFWGYIADQISELNQLLQDQNRYYSNPSTKAPSSESQGKKSSPATSGPHLLDVNNLNNDTSNGFTDHATPAQGDSPSMDRAIEKSTFFRPSDSHPSRFHTFSPELLEHMPTKEQSHTLYRCYMTGVHVILPMVHPPTTLKFYESFWDWYDQGKDIKGPYQYPAFIPLLYAIWYAGSVSIAAKALKGLFGNIPRARLSAQFHDQVTRCLTLTSFPQSPTVPSLIAFLIVQTILAREEEPLHGSFFISLALRVAQMMGLHRDPAQFGIGSPHSEIRRRVWWRISALDHIMSICSGLPPSICSDNFYDVQEVSELKDSLLGTAEGEHYEKEVANGDRTPDNPDDPLNCGGESMVSIVYVVAKARNRMMRLSRKAVEILLGAKPIHKKDLERMREYVWESERILNETLKRIPDVEADLSELCPSPNQDGGSMYDANFEKGRPATKDEFDPFKGCLPLDGLTDQHLRYHKNAIIAFYKWAKIWLSLLIDKTYCVAYAPFLKNARSKLWENARQCALRHCHGFMDKFIQLATDPVFQPFHWSWPGTHQPMHAVMIMLVDLYERPHSAEASQSRFYIDKVFSLSGPDGGIVSGEDGVSVQRPLREGGREAWDMIRRLRHKAWRKAGLDPDLLWTEPDQVKARMREDAKADTPSTVASKSTGDTTIKKSPESTRSDSQVTPKPSRFNAFHDLLAAAQADAEATEAYKTARNTGNVTGSAPPGTAPDSLGLSNTPMMHPPPTDPAQAVQYFYSAPCEPINPSRSNPPPQPYPHTLLRHPSSSSHNFTGSTTYPTYPTPSGQQPQHPQLQSQTTSTDPVSFHQPNYTTYSSNYYPPHILSGATIPSTSAPVDPSSASSNAKPVPVDGNSPNNFDWDHWDAVFGQYAPVDDMVDVNGWKFGR
ncbi:MAG: hypothetical protein M1834_006033 [Cirrosporium novae-zelandiae]|nr:MAG: hypothetical protein M1834_006033 [Cirrosporium novae-zelandiae]